MIEMTTKASLSTQQRRLIELMQRINFGRIEGLEVCDGAPVFDPPPIVVRDVKFSGENGARYELEATDFFLKKEVIKFFAQLTHMRNGTVEMLEIKHGLPFLLRIRETVRT